MKTGKHTKNGPYVPLADILRGYPTIVTPPQLDAVRQAIGIAGPDALDADIVVIEPHQVRFGWFANLGAPHPHLGHSIRVMRDGSILPGINAGAIYHRMEQMIPHDHPLQKYYQKLTALELRPGLLTDPQPSGSRREWNARVQELVDAGERRARRLFA